MELFCKASIANGLVGWNHYMFSQGSNPRRMGLFRGNFYWFTPVTAEGDRSSAFPLIRQMSEVIKTSENLIVNAKTESRGMRSVYPPYYATRAGKTG